MTIHQIRSRIDALRAEAHQLVTAAGDNPMAENAEQRFQAIEAETAQLRAAERRQAFIDEADRNSLAAPLNGDARFDAFASEVRLSDVVAATLGENTRGAGMAREASAELARQRGRNPTGLYVSLRSLGRQAERRSLTSGAQGTAGNGAALVPTIVSDMPIDPLRAATVLAGLGATYLTGLTGNISIPRVSQGTSTGWFGENQPIPDTDMAFDAVPLQVKHVGAITEYSRNMMLNSTADVDALLRTDLMRALAVEIDRAALVGVGDGVTPRGVLNMPGVAKVTFGDGLSWANVLALPAAVDNANVPMSRPGFVGNGLIRAKAMGTLTAPGIASPFIMSGPDSLAGYRYAATNIVPVSPAVTGAGTHPARSTLVFGSWENLLVGVWDALDLTSNPYSDTAYRKGSVQVRIIADVDVAVRHVEAFAYANDVAA